MVMTKAQRAAYNRRRYGASGLRYNPRTKKVRRVAAARKPLVKARAPIVECKKNNTQGAIPLGNYYNVLIPDAYEAYQQGLGSNNVIGDNIFSKYLNGQFQITFATEAARELNAPIVLQVLMGYCKLPENKAPTEAPAGSPPGQYDGIIHDYDPQQHILDYLTHVFDPNITLPKNDREVFSLFHNKEYHMLGNQIIFDNNDNKIHRFRKPLNFYGKWKPMRKLNLQPVTNQSTGPSTHLSPTNKPGQWIPFFAVINKTNTVATGDAAPILLTNTTHYFTDS